MKPDSEFGPMVSLLTLTVLIVSLGKIPNTIAQSDEPYETCRTTFDCGDVGAIGYPFWGGERPDYCGYPGFGLTCLDSTPRLNMSSASYRVLEINGSNQTLRIARDDLSSTLCPRFLRGTTLDMSLFDFSAAHGHQNVTLFYECGTPRPPPEAPPVHNRFDCDVNGSRSWGYYLTRGLIGLWSNVTLACGENITVPVNDRAAAELANVTVGSVDVLRHALSEGFWIRWRADEERCRGCAESGGLCGRNLVSGSFACYCRDGTHNSSCDMQSGDGNSNNSNSSMPVTGSNNNSNSGIRIGLPIGGAVLAGIGVGWLILYCRQRRKQRVERLSSRSNQAVSKDTTTPSSKPLYSSKSALSFMKASNSDLGWGNTYYGVQVFDYAELEEATDNFNPSRVLGEGGFGSVYHGTLSDGRVVAVKRLYENNFKRVEQFMNEVEILACLRHKNLVSLYGCTSRRSHQLLLVYEFIPNGTVADHLHGRLRLARPALLPWSVRLNIAVETAEALNYLHESDIVHRDIKTNNILLDLAFHVKVADFGLSRLFPNDVTHVSTVPQGTPGYVDPEYYQTYQLTEKSDVYSFGVVLVELLSSLMAVDTNRQRQDINLASMALNRIQNQALDELVDPGLGFRTDSGVRRAATLVAELAFGCLQRESKMRPSMGEVLTGLKRIRDEGMGSGHAAEIVDLQAGDDVGPPRDGVEPPSPNSGSGQNSSE